MKNFRSAVLVDVAIALAFGLSSCTNSARINGTLSDAPESEVIIKLLNVNQYQVLDTVKTDKDGAFFYRVKIAKGQPDFIYLFHRDTKIASLLLNRGDNVKVTADTLGSYSVEGSDESGKLQEVEKDYTDFMVKFAATTSQLNGLDPGSDEAKSIRKDLSKQYVDYYRSRVRYLLQNSNSLTTVPVLYQKINDNFPIFSQPTDAIHFRAVTDSLKKIYPLSRYVIALEKDTKVRESNMSMGIRLQDATQLGFPELSIPDTKGKEVKLSQVKAKLVMVFFWTASDAANKMFNLDVLVPLYNEYHSKGLEIYQVGIDNDKTNWASVVKDQQLPWINVCDGLGTQSSAVTLYNITKLPVAYFIKDGELQAQPSTGKAIAARVKSLI
jgi:hypothetical protein